MNEIFACVDITGSNRAWDVVWVDAQCHVQAERFCTSETFVDWIREKRPRILAIDAPSGKNQSVTRDVEIRRQYGWEAKYSKERDNDGERQPLYGNMRLCEALLVSRGIGIYSTPLDSERAARWIQRGWALYARLREQCGYALWTRQGKVTVNAQPTLIEVHPHACFVVGLERVPPDKVTLSGQLERAAYLRDAARLCGRPLHGDCLPAQSLLSDISQLLGRADWTTIRAHGIQVPSLKHDVLDALGGLTTAIRAHEGLAHAVGDEREGTIVLPSEPCRLGTTYRLVR